MHAILPARLKERDAVGTTLGHDLSLEREEFAGDRDPIALGKIARDLEPEQLLEVVRRERVGRLLVEDVRVEVGPAALKTGVARRPSLGNAETDRLDEEREKKSARGIDKRDGLPEPTTPARMSVSTAARWVRGRPASTRRWSHPVGKGRPATMTPMSAAASSCAI
jgi:hypothetical protein